MNRFSRILPVLLAVTLAPAAAALAQGVPGGGMSGGMSSGAMGSGTMGSGTMGSGAMGSPTMGAMPAPMAAGAAAPSLSVMGSATGATTGATTGAATALGAATQPGPLSSTAATVAASPDGAGALVADHGIIYETKNAGDATQAFLTIQNQGKSSDTLTALACPIADSTTLVDADGKPSASPVGIAPGKPLTLTAKGQHLAITSTHFAIYPGSTIPCALTFRNAGAIQVMLTARRQPTS